MFLVMPVLTGSNKALQVPRPQPELDAPDKQNPAGTPPPMKPHPQAQEEDPGRHEPKAMSPRWQREASRVDDGENRTACPRVCQLVGNGRARHLGWLQDRHRCRCGGCDKPRRCSSGCQASLTLVYVWGREIAFTYGKRETSASTASTTVTITRTRLLINLVRTHLRWWQVIRPFNLSGSVVE